MTTWACLDKLEQAHISVTSKLWMLISEVVAVSVACAGQML